MLPLRVLLPAALVMLAFPQAAEARPRHRETRAELRRALARQVRRDPRAVLRAGFIEKAQAVDYVLPLTVRLNAKAGTSGAVVPSDDVAIAAWDGTSWPLAGTVAAAPASTTLSGSFAMELDFGADTSGYGALGTVETLQGQGAALQGTPIEVADQDGTCPAPGPALSTGTIAFTSADAQRGTLNLVSGTIHGALHLQATTAGTRTPCAGSAAATPAVTSPAAAPLPLLYDGTLRISPAITADGRLRLAVMDADAAVTPQRDAFAAIHVCTVAGGAPCAAGQDVGFPSRLSVGRLHAELLIGGNL